MGFLVNLLQLFKSGMCVHLCGAQTGMPKKFLYCIQLGTPVQQVGGIGVPQNMRTLAFCHGDFHKRSMNDAVNQPGIETLSFISKKQVSIRSIAEFKIANPDEFRQ